MKTRNKILTGVLALLIGSGVLFASGWGGDNHGRHSADHHSHYHHGEGKGRKHGGRSLERMMKHMTRHLDLNDSQKSALTEIYDSHRDQLRAGKDVRRSMRLAAMNLDPKSANYDDEVNKIVEEASSQAAERVRLMASVYKDVSGVLSAEQMAEVRQMIEKRADKMKRRADRHSKSS